MTHLSFASSTQIDLSDSDELQSPKARYQLGCHHPYGKSRVGFESQNLLPNHSHRKVEISFSSSEEHKTRFSPHYKSYSSFSLNDRTLVFLQKHKQKQYIKLTKEHINASCLLDFIHHLFPLLVKALTRCQELF